MSKNKVEAKENGGEKSDLEAALSDARARIDANSLEAAGAAISRLLQAYPQDRRPVLLQGELLLRRGDLDDALNLAEAGLKEEPDCLDFHRLEISTLLEKQAFLEALKRTRGSLPKYKMDADLMVYRCRAFFGLGRFEQLEALAARGAAKHPSDRRFDAFLEPKKQTDEAASETSAQDAEKACRRALQKARASFGSGHYEQSAKAAQGALDKHPDHHDLTLLLCRSLMKLDRNLEMEKIAQRGLAHRPGDKALAQLKGKALVGRGAYEEAAELVRDALDKHPDDYELSALLCRSLVSLGRDLEAEEVAQRALSKFPGDRALTRVKCLALLHRGAYEEANTEASAFLSENQGEPVFLVIKGQALLRLNRAQDYCREVTPPPLSDFKRSSGAIGIYAQCLEQSGAWQAIIDYLEPGIKAGHPLPGSAQAALSAAYIKQGRRVDAESLYDSIVKAQEPRLAKDFSENIARIRELFPLVLPDSKLSQTALDRLWSFADQGKWSRAEWTDRICWGHSIQRLMLAWILSDLHRTSEIMKLVEHCDLDAVEAEIAAGRSLLLTGGHMGAFPAILAAFAEREVPSILVSRYAIPQARLPRNMMCLTASPHPLTTYRAIKDGLSEPRVLLLAGDMDRYLGQSERGYTVTLFGNDVLAPSTPPWIAYHTNLETYWSQAMFHGNRIRITASKMIAPEPGESKEALATRWQGSYLKRYLALLRSDPSNICMQGGPVLRALNGEAQDFGSSIRLPIDLDLSSS